MVHELFTISKYTSLFDVDHWLSFCLLTNVLPIRLPFTASDYPFGIGNPFLTFMNEYSG